MSAVKIAEECGETVDICQLEVPSWTTFPFMKTDLHIPSGKGATFLSEKVAVIKQP